MNMKPLRTWLLGPTLNLHSTKTPKKTLLAAFITWIGLGADSLSSACYGPESAFLALGSHRALALYIALLIAVTVFVIAGSYNQIIRLFPNGGGGYRAATALIGPKAGLLSGSALIVDYVLTIAISIASGIDALFSLLALEAQAYKLIAELGILLVLGTLNLRGIKESIRVLMPIVLLFFISHALFIVYGLATKSTLIPTLIPETLAETGRLRDHFGWLFVVALLLRAYSLGGGTYTGIEAISNNVQNLEHPRVRTGHCAMRYIAYSLAFTAGGIILLYLLWDVTALPGKTLNAVLFQSMVHDWQWQGYAIGTYCLFILMGSEAGLLIAAANTGYIGGPSILATMALDDWIPRPFRYLSARLVTENGILLMGILAGLFLWWTQGSVKTLIILYSINVFITFSLSLFGLCLYWLRNQGPFRQRAAACLIALMGFTLSFGILVVTLYEKFTEGGWITIAMTLFICVLCFYIKKLYETFNQSMDHISHQALLSLKTTEALAPIPPLDARQSTAVFIVGEHLGLELHTLKKVLSLFPDHYSNCIFLGIAEVNYKNYNPSCETVDQKADLSKMSDELQCRLNQLVHYCHHKAIAAASYQLNHTDTLEGLEILAKKVHARYKNSVFFSGKIVFKKNKLLNYWLHNHTATLIEAHLQSKGLYVMLLPIVF
jgi:amino acid transporter